MKPAAKPIPTLADIEREVAAESREWGRQRLEERLQQLAEQHGEAFPPQAASAQAPDTSQRVRGRKTDR
jgi:hypothetical protein